MRKKWGGVLGGLCLAFLIMRGDVWAQDVSPRIWLLGYGTTQLHLDLYADGVINHLDLLRRLVERGTVSPTPTGVVPTIPPGTGDGVWVSVQKVKGLPTSGPAWQSLYGAAGSSWGSPSVANQDSSHDVYTLAGALVCVRTGEFCDKARVGLMSAIGTEGNSRWLAIGRNMTAYTIAADLLRNDRKFVGDEQIRVTNWLASFLTRKLPNNNSGVLETIPVFESGSNASAQQAAVAAAISVYMNDRNMLAYVWNRFRLYSCDRANNPENEINLSTGFGGGWSHATSESQACGVNPAGTTKNGRRIDGAIINDMVRGGSFTWPPEYTSYPWVGLEGYVPTALILHRAGYAAFQISHQAVLRTHDYLWEVRTGTGNAAWFDGSRANEIVHLVNVAYGKAFLVNGSTGIGRTVGFTDWTHATGL